MDIVAININKKTQSDSDEEILNTAILPHFGHFGTIFVSSEIITIFLYQLNKQLQ